MTLATTDAVEAGTILTGTYQLVRRIGAGGSGEVWEAAHARTGGPCAVKLPFAELIDATPGALERIRGEVRAMSPLTHPGIVKVLDLDMTPAGRPFLVMELLTGASLDSVLSRSPILPLARVLDIVRQTASALAAAHDGGVVHRDLKPENIFLAQAGTGGSDVVKIMDFGISRGSPHYMSPEQVRADADAIDARTDQFALGVVTYEMLAGHRAFAGDSAHDVCQSVLENEPAPLPPGTPKLVEDVLRVALSKKREDRFDNILAFATALENAARTVASEAAPDPGDEDLVVPKTRFLPPRARVAVAAGFLVAIMMGAYAAGRHSSQPGAIAVVAPASPRSSESAPTVAAQEPSPASVPAAPAESPVPATRPSPDISGAPGRKPQATPPLATNPTLAVEARPTLDYGAVSKRNRDAMEDFYTLEDGSAVDKLTSLLKDAAEAGLKGPAIAATHFNLGVVYQCASPPTRNWERSVMEFRKARRIDPALRPEQHYERDGCDAAVAKALGEAGGVVPRGGPR